MQHIIAPNIEYVLIIMSDGLEVKSISDILAFYVMLWLVSCSKLLPNTGQCKIQTVKGRVFEVYLGALVIFEPPGLRRRA